MRLFPSGETFYTRDELPGTFEGALKAGIRLWDVKTGASRTLEERQHIGCFSPDGRTLTLTITDEDGYSQALKLIETATSKEKWSVPIAEKNAGAGVGAFSGDGRLLFRTARGFDRPKKWGTARSCLKPQPRIHLIEVATGEIRETMIAPQSFSNDACFSLDGRTLTTDGPGRVLLWDMTKMSQ